MAETNGPSREGQISMPGLSTGGTGSTGRNYKVRVEAREIRWEMFDGIN
jgi:hypothetical protein